jgi:hypothetical protein
MCTWVARTGCGPDAKPEPAAYGQNWRPRPAKPPERLEPDKRLDFVSWRVIFSLLRIAEQAAGVCGWLGEIVFQSIMALYSMVLKRMTLSSEQLTWFVHLERDLGIGFILDNIHSLELEMENLLSVEYAMKNIRQYECLSEAMENIKVLPNWNNIYLWNRKNPDGNYWNSSDRDHGSRNYEVLPSAAAWFQ